MKTSKTSVIFTAVAAAVGGVVAAPPVVSDVTLAQPPNRRVAEVAYQTDRPGIATFQFKTNGVDICHSEIVHTVTGSISKYLPAGSHTFTWDAKTDFPGQIVSNLTVEVTLWATNNPPLFCAVDLAEQGGQYPVSWYGKESEVPFGVTDSRWKTGWLLLRQIPSTQGETTTLGAPVGERRSNNSTNGNDNARLTRITKPFYMGVYQVTQLQWETIAASVRSKPSSFSNPLYWEERPVESVSYNDIRGTAGSTYNWPNNGHAVAPASFMGLLRAKTGNILTFDLPTDSQWEYACRAGTSGAWNNGTTITNDNNDANLPLLGRCTLNGGSVPSGLTTADCTDENGTAKVGSYLPNAWGLYDMHCNVFEWCLDWYTIDTTLLTGDDPPGPASGTQRMLRGGRWGNAIRDCRQAFRFPGNPTTRNDGWGFRAAASAEVLVAP